MSLKKGEGRKETLEVSSRKGHARRKEEKEEGGGKNELDGPELLVELTEESFVSMSFGGGSESKEDLTSEEVGV